MTMRFQCSTSVNMRLQVAIQVFVQAAEALFRTFPDCSQPEDKRRCFLQLQDAYINCISKLFHDLGADTMPVRNSGKALPLEACTLSTFLIKFNVTF